MTTQRLSYDWRIPTAGLMLLAILVAGFTLHSHWNAFIQWCLTTQITLHRYLVMYLLQLNNHQYSGGLWLLTGAFYGAARDWPGTRQIYRYDLSQHQQREPTGCPGSPLPRQSDAGR
jgi:hypothetical protein